MTYKLAQILGEIAWKQKKKKKTCTNLQTYGTNYSRAHRSLELDRVKCASIRSVILMIQTHIKMIINEIKWDQSYTWALCIPRVIFHHNLFYWDQHLLGSSPSADKDLHDKLCYSPSKQVQLLAFRYEM